MAVDQRNNPCSMVAPASTSIIPPRHRRRNRWRTKHYLSVAMVGALVAIALVAAISVCLAPAQLTFSIAEANVAIYVHLNHNNTHLNFILSVNNSSPRTAVRYGPMTGEISYGPGARAWVRCSKQSNVSQAPLSAVNISFSADYGYNEGVQDAVDNCRILMVSKVWFAWLGLPTLPYTVRFSCEAVNFQNRTYFPVRCA